MAQLVVNFVRNEIVPKKGEALSTRSSKKISRIRIVNAAVSSQRIRGREMKVIRGELKPEFLKDCRVPSYQRNAMSGEKHTELVSALDPDDGIGVPDDLLLCVRGDQHTQAGAGEIIIASGPLFVLDGHQRFDAAEERLEHGQTIRPLGVKILLGTTQSEEIRIFYQVNRKQTKVTTQVFLRNSGDNAAIAALRTMTEKDPDFPTVQWDQDRPRTHPFITARMLYEAAVVLHGFPQKGEFEELIDNLEKLTAEIGTEQLVENVQTFFKVVEKCFNKDGRKKYTYRMDVLRGLALLFNGYQNFWAKSDPNKLVVRANEITKIKALALSRLEVALSRGNAGTTLFHTLEAHVNAARTENPLMPRPKRERDKRQDLASTKNGGA